MAFIFKSYNINQMKKSFKSILVISIFAALSVSCSTNIDVKDLTGFWQGECGRGFQFTDKGTYFFYFIENGTWKCSGDSENNFFVKGNEIRCEWTENGETKAICYSVDSFTKQKMKLRSAPGDISDGKYIKVSAPSHIDVEERKSALASTTLAQIDSLYLLYLKALDQSFDLSKFELTEKEKLVKPEYLLNLSASNDFVTRSQKVNALAIFFIERDIKKIYDMPLEDTKQTIAQLAAELNQAIDIEYLRSDAPVSEKLEREYEVCKERGDLAYFWQFQYAIFVETTYLLAQNPELFLRRISDEQYQAFHESAVNRIDVIMELAKYDEEMAMLKSFIDQNNVWQADKDYSSTLGTKELRIKYFIDNKDNIIARRNAILH